MKIQKVLVVCIGNICRSPMGEYFFRHKRPDLHTHSAGISAMIGYPADDKAVYCMDQLQIDMRPHVAKKINDTMIKEADLILVMSQRQLRHLEQTYPFAKGKTFRLGHWQHMDIADPYQHDQHVFNETCVLIEKCVDQWIHHL